MLSVEHSICFLENLQNKLLFRLSETIVIKNSKTSPVLCLFLYFQTFHKNPIVRQVILALSSEQTTTTIRQYHSRQGRCCTKPNLTTMADNVLIIVVVTSVKRKQIMANSLPFISSDLQLSFLAMRAFFGVSRSGAENKRLFRKTKAAFFCCFRRNELSLKSDCSPANWGAY